MKTYKNRGTHSAFILYTGESDDESHMQEFDETQNSTVTKILSIVDSIATLPAEIKELDKIGFDQTIEVEEYENI